MSIAKLKKQFEAFSTYLHRDVTGHEHLRKLKESFLELRVQLAATTAKQDEAVALLEPVSRRAVDAEQRLIAAEAEIRKLQQQLDSSTQRLNALVETVAKTAAEDTADVAIAGSEADVDEATIKSVLKQLRKTVKHCPNCVRKTTKIIVSGSHILPVLQRSSVIRGWSHADLWTLGATVSALLLFEGGQVVIQDNELHEKTLAFKTDPESDDSFGRHLMQWFFKYNTSMDTTANRAGGMRFTSPPDPWAKIFGGQ